MNSFARAQLADDLLSEGRHADAWAELQKVPLEDDEILDVIFVRVQTLFALRRYAEALPLARRLVELGPDVEAHWRWLAMTSRKMFGDNADRPIYEEAVSRYPCSASFRYNLASRYCSMQRIHEAREHMAMCLVLDPSCRELAMDDPTLTVIWETLTD
jgi:tetratricopeptide (TPR) repeat protein